MKPAFELPDDWFVENDGQRLVLDPEKVKAAFEARVALQGWQPIESAPVGDDDFFLVCGVGDDRSAFVVRGSILKNTRMANTPSHLSMHWLTLATTPPATSSI